MGRIVEDIQEVPVFGDIMKYASHGGKFDSAIKKSPAAETYTAGQKTDETE